MLVSKSLWVRLLVQGGVQNVARVLGLVEKPYSSAIPHTGSLQFSCGHNIQPPRFSLLNPVLSLTSISIRPLRLLPRWRTAQDPLSGRTTASDFTTVIVDNKDRTLSTRKKRISKRSLFPVTETYHDILFYETLSK